MTRIAFDYDTTYAPPAPVVEIEVNGYHPTLGTRTLHAMLDTGADASMLPVDVLNSIGAMYKESAWMRGPTEGRQQVDLYLVSIQIGSDILRGLHVIAAPNSAEAIVGRDALNQLVVTLNGIVGVTELEQQTA